MPNVVVEQLPLSLEDETKCLATVVEAKLPSVNELALSINAAFLPRAVDQGVIVRVECQVGITGARFAASADGVAWRNLTPPDVVSTSHTLGTTTSRSDKDTASVTAKAAEAELKADLGSSERQSSMTTSISFGSQESRLAVTELTGAGIRWHLRPHRGAKAIADYLEGNLILKAGVQWQTQAPPVITVRAQPTDIRYFGPKGEVLSRRASMALWLYLRVTGHKVPSRKASKHVVRIVNDGGDQWAETPLR